MTRTIGVTIGTSFISGFCKNNRVTPAFHVVSRLTLAGGKRNSGIKVSRIAIKIISLVDPEINSVTGLYRDLYIEVVPLSVPVCYFFRPQLFMIFQYFYENSVSALCVKIRETLPLITIVPLIGLTHFLAASPPCGHAHTDVIRQNSRRPFHWTIYRVKFHIFISGAVPFLIIPVVIPLRRTRNA